jgi:hypothetical protein
MPPKIARAGSERRREPRLRLSGDVAATVQTAFPATIIDFSVGGAQLDVAYTLKPGGPCVLGLALPGDRQLKLYGRVLRSNLHKLQPVGGGDAVAHYRAAVEFTGLTDEQRTGIQELLLDFEGTLAAELAAELDASFDDDAPALELEADLPEPSGSSGATEPPGAGRP